jgi:hypothetical protein
LAEGIVLLLLWLGAMCLMLVATAHDLFTFAKRVGFGRRRDGNKE